MQRINKKTKKNIIFTFLLVFISFIFPSLSGATQVGQQTSIFPQSDQSVQNSGTDAKAGESSENNSSQSSPVNPIAARLNNEKSLTSSNELLRNAAQFYKNRQFKPVWFDGNALKKEAQVVLETLRNAHLEGLHTDDYKQAGELVEEALSDSTKVIDAEIALTAYALEYIDDLYGERLNPKRVNKTLYIKEKKIDAVGIATKYLEDNGSWEWIRSLTVNHPQYQAMKSELAKIRHQADTTRYPQLASGPKIEKGSRGGRVETIQWQLRTLGYLSSNAKPGEVDKATEEAIRSFQDDNSLIVDGVVGPLTTDVLNSFTPQERIKKLIVTMERWRWMPEDLGEKYIRVNIANFELYAYKNGEQVLQMPVIIGRKYRKTPVFSSNIYSIRFNPSWHVPRSIAVKDKLRKIKKDPGYLARGNYVLYDSSGNQVNPHSINWASVTGANFNYRLRQRPGNHNALGKIRFAIKSPFNIYLHDTNERHLFTKRSRSLSSGCIRVQNPEILAEYVFDDQKTWPLTRIQENMNGTRTSNIAVESPVKIYITYFTVFEGADGSLKFMPDIYKQDESIWLALKKRKKSSL